MTEIRYSKVLRRDYDEMQSAEARLMIARSAGLNKTPRSPFGKRDLNAIYAYLTGEHYFPKEDWYTPDSPRIGEIRQAIAQHVGFSYDPGEDWNLPFKRAQLRQLAEEVENQQDRRLKDNDNG